jgi:hypothetical protein
MPELEEVALVEQPQLEGALSRELANGYRCAAP